MRTKQAALRATLLGSIAAITTACIYDWSSPDHGAGGATATAGSAGAGTTTGGTGTTSTGGGPGTGGVSPDGGTGSGILPPDCADSSIRCGDECCPVARQYCRYERPAPDDLSGTGTFRCGDYPGGECAAALDAGTIDDACESCVWLTETTECVEPECDPEGTQPPTLSCAAGDAGA